MECFAKIVYSLKPLTIFEKRSIRDVWQDYEYALCWCVLLFFALIVLMLFTFSKFYMKTDRELDRILGESKAIKLNMKRLVEWILPNIQWVILWFL